MRSTVLSARSKERAPTVRSLFEWDWSFKADATVLSSRIKQEARMREVGIADKVVVRQVRGARRLGAAHLPSPHD